MHCRCHPREIERRWNACDLAEIQAWSLLRGGFGEEAAWQRTALLAALLANQWAEEGDARNPSDFLPPFDDELKDEGPIQSEAEMERAMMAMAGLMSGDRDGD